MAEQKEEKKVDRNALQVFKDDVMTVWTSASNIRKLFAPTLSDEEFKFFCGMGVALGANPFKREIFAVKYGTDPAAIIIARDKTAKGEVEYELSHYKHYIRKYSIQQFLIFIPLLMLFLAIIQKFKGK